MTLFKGGNVFSGPTQRNALMPRFTQQTRSNYRVLVVGEPPQVSDPPDYWFSGLGLRTDFRTIGEAMGAIPLVSDVGKHNYVARWTILLTPGYYQEEIRIKPFVSIVGLDRNSVFIEPPPDPGSVRDGRGGAATLNRRRPAEPAPEEFGQAGRPPRRANVYMNYFTNLTNVTLLKRGDARDGDYVIWNRDTYGLRPLNQEWDERERDLAPSFCGIEGVDVQLGGGSSSGHSLARTLLLDGSFRTFIVTSLTTSHNAPSGYDIELFGHRRFGKCDTHFISCFFDDLFIERAGSGCVQARWVDDVHIRNSLLRVGAANPDAALWPNGFPGTALYIQAETRVALEATLLSAAGAPDAFQVLRIEEPDPTFGTAGGLCDFHFSEADSVRGEGQISGSPRRFRG